MSFSTVFSRHRTGPSPTGLSRSRKSNAERSALPRLFAVLFLAGTVGLLGGCHFGGGSGSLDYPEGTFTASAGDSYVISGTTVEYVSSFDSAYNRTAQIVRIVESGINGEDTTLATSGVGGTTAETTINPGYVVIKYTEADGVVGKYNILRWGDVENEGNAKLFVEFASTSPSFSWGNFASIEAAEAGAVSSATGASLMSGKYLLQE